MIIWWRQFLFSLMQPELARMEANMVKWRAETSLISRNNHEALMQQVRDNHTHVCENFAKQDQGYNQLHLEQMTRIANLLELEIKK